MSHVGRCSSCAALPAMELPPARRRLSGVSAQTDSVTADELSAALSGVGTRALLRNASTLTEHANWDLLTTVVRDGNVSLLARLALAYTLLQTSCGDESQADAHRNTLGLLLLQRAAEPGLTEPECELLETVRALPIPSWADEAAMREALILLCPPEGEADQSIWTPMQLLPPLPLAHHFVVATATEWRGEDPVLSADARGVILDRAATGHFRIGARPRPSTMSSPTPAAGQRRHCLWPERCRRSRCLGRPPSGGGRPPSAAVAPAPLPLHARAASHPPCTPSPVGLLRGLPSGWALGRRVWRRCAAAMPSPQPKRRAHC